MSPARNQIPGLLRDFFSEEEQRSLLEKAVWQNVSAGQPIQREDVPNHAYFVMSGEVSIRSGNVADLARVADGRGLDLRSVLLGLRGWETAWRVEKDAEILALPWAALNAGLAKRPRNYEYLSRITQFVELQKLKRDLRVFGYGKTGIIDLISCLKFGPLDDVSSADLSFFCVVSEGAVEVVINLNDRDQTLVCLEAGDQGVIDREMSSTHVKCAPGTKGWYLEIADMERLASKEHFLKFVRLYLGSRQFAADESQPEATVWAPLPQNASPAKAMDDDGGREKTISSYRRNYFKPNIDQIEESWYPAAALVRIGEISGIPIGLYRARRSLLGWQNNSVLQGLAGVCRFLDFDVQLLPLLKVMSRKKHFPFLASMGSSPVMVWEIKGAMVKYEKIGAKNLRSIDVTRFAQLCDDTAMIWRRKPRSLGLKDEKISLNSYLKLLKHSRMKVSVLILTGAISFLISLSIPMIYQYFFTSVLNSKRWGIAGILIAAYVAARVLNALLDGIESSISFALTQNNQVRFVSVYLLRLARIPVKFYDFLGPTELLSRFEEAQQVGWLVGEVLIRPAAKVISILTCFFILYLYHPRIAYTAAAMIPLIVVITAMAASRRKKLNATTEHYKAAERRILIEAFDHPETLRSNNVTLMTRWRWEQNFIQSTAATLKVTIENAFLNAFDFFCQEASKFVILGVGLSLFMKGEMTQGQVLACFLLTERLTNPLWAVIRLFYEVPAMHAHLERFDPIFGTSEERVQGHRYGNPVKLDRDRPPLISLDKVSFRYGAAAKEVIRDVTCEIRPGEKIGIVGPSGCGKSTLVSLLNGLRMPTGGKLTIDGQSLESIPFDQLRSTMGVVAQKFNLFHGTILENITMGAENSSLTDAAAAARIAGADSFISKLPNSYGFLVQRGGGGLSEGQSQMIAVARALYSRPEVFILDEATCHLDPVTEEGMIRDLLETQKEKTIVFVTQHANLLARMDRIFVMQDGRIIEQGRHFDLIGRCDLYTDLFTRQVSLG